MKKYLLFIFIIIFSLGMLAITQAQENSDYSMQLPSFNISIMGNEVDNLHNRNPMLVHNGITYIPITNEYGNALFFESNWSDNSLKINTSGKSGQFVQDKSVINDKNKKYPAVEPSFDVYLNGKLITNENSNYPILVYNGITYFPLVEEYLNNDFNISVKWSEGYGLIIGSKTNNEKQNDIKQQNINLNKTLEKAIRIKLGKPQGVLTKSDLLSIKALSLSRQNLNNLSGIEYLTNIEELYLDNNSLVEIHSLASLTNLKILHLQRNSIEDISPLTGLSNLRELSLNGNRVSSLQPLNGLTNLEKLYFIDNNITDISPLKSLINLKTLYMKHGNYIRNYSPIASYHHNIIDNDFKSSQEEFGELLASNSKPFLNIAELIEEASHRNKHDLKLNGYYAISSNEQYNDFKIDGSINTFDSISFGWAFVNYDSQTNMPFISINSQTNEFHIPEGYKDPVNYMSKHNIDTNINIYTSRNYDALFANSDMLINQIVKLLQGKNEQYNGLSFKSVVIDFEELPASHKESYILFLHKLNKELTKYNKKLIVAVSPSKSYDFAKIVEIADNVILMLHDYDIKNSNSLTVISNRIDNPNTPIEKVKGDLINILNQIDREKYMSKLWLQINFSVSQWKVQNSMIINQTPFTPKYDNLVERIHTEKQSGKNIGNIIQYNHMYQNPYIVYNENGITNSIWYEDDRSVSAKIKLAKDLGLGGISLWRIGNIPDYSSDMYLNTWDLIQRLND